MALTTVDLLPYALGSVEDVTTYLKLPQVPIADEAEIFKRVINAATKRVEMYTGRPFLTRALTENYSGTGTRRLYLRALPVIDITQVDYLDYQGVSAVTYSPSDIRLLAEHGIIMLVNGGIFTEGLSNWQVQYNASFATLADVPDDVTIAFLKLCAEYWRDYQHRKDDIMSQTVDGQTTFFNQDLMPPKIKSILKPYAIPAGMGVL